jgi:hypothetical protein
LGSVNGRPAADCRHDIRTMTPEGDDMAPLVRSIADELVRVVDEAAAELRTISDADASIRTRPEAWSIKEIVGHLIDSAVNNHHRFVRAPQTDELAFPGYEQDVWVDLQDYRTSPWPELVELWALYNRHLAHVIRRLPDAALGVACRIHTSAPVTLQFLLEDYLEHLQHHLRQIGERRERLPYTR